MGTVVLLVVTALLFLLRVHCHGFIGFDPLDRVSLGKLPRSSFIDTSSWVETPEADASVSYSPVLVGAQEGSMESDRIRSLPGQPRGVDFSQYAGYVTVDEKSGRALFYYFAEAPQSTASQRPLVLWLNGGPGCSSFGNGAMLELGPFRVERGGKTLTRNGFSWNSVANVIFLESPAGVGFSYSNTTSDYKLSGDRKTAEDSYTFLVNWLERFPQYKARDFYIAGESYAGHFVPQLAQKILQRNKFGNQTFIRLRGVALGNAVVDDETSSRGMVDFFWMRDLISDEIHSGITSTCNFSAAKQSKACYSYIAKASNSVGNIDVYNIYAPLCNYSSLTSPSGDQGFDPCSDAYVHAYLNKRQVQKALHARPMKWDSCSISVNSNWGDSQSTVLPIVEHLMASGIRIWIYSGDIDGRVPVTSSKYAIEKLKAVEESPWYPWYCQGEVGGYAVGYKGLVFVTVRGAGHLVPSYQPVRAFVMFSSFLEGKLPPSS